MSVITISRQLGSQGDKLAQQVAQKLGWRRVSRALINQAAQAAGAPEVALAEIDELGFFNLKPTASERQAYQTHIERIIRELADQGNVVIVGRGGQVILSGRDDVFHVRVIAPIAFRALRVQQEKKISMEAAKACLERSNRTRTRYLWRNYARHLDDPSLYHLVVNTGLIELPQAVNLVVRAYRDWAMG